MSVTTEDKNKFDRACKTVLDEHCLQRGVGTLGEKSMHACLKNFYAPDFCEQEIKIKNHIADIYKDGEIIEIQTRNLGALKKKLDNLLDDYHITVVHPIAHHKWLYYIDEGTGEISNKRKSPKCGDIYDAFYELYNIRDYISHPHMHICLPLIDVHEYRLKKAGARNRRKSTTRYDRIPVELVDEIYLHEPKDYIRFIPKGLSKSFTIKDYAKAVHIDRQYAWSGIQILKSAGIVGQTGKQGNTHIYTVSTG